VYKIKTGIKTINIENIIKQDKDKTVKFIRNVLGEDFRGSIIIEVNDHNDNELICNITDDKTLSHTDLEEELEPALRRKKINILELWRFDYNTFYIKNKDRTVISEYNKQDFEEFLDYCRKKNLDIDDLLYTILSA
jgi:hypothetical protein